MKLLVVDFDFFFPMKEEWDWSMKETPFYIDGILWEIRASSFLYQGQALPVLNGLEKDFWDHWNLTNVSLVFYSDSNSYSGVLPCRDLITEVVLIDAHHDSGYNGSIKQAIKGEITCDNWMYVYHNAKRLWVYPDWLDGANKQKSDQKTDRIRWSEYNSQGYTPDIVHICRSGAWVPPWCDSDFIKFVNSLSSGKKYDLDKMDKSSIYRSMIRRKFSIRNTIEMSKQTKKMNKQMRNFIEQSK